MLKIMFLPAFCVVKVQQRAPQRQTRAMYGEARAATRAKRGSATRYLLLFFFDFDADVFFSAFEAALSARCFSFAAVTQRRVTLYVAPAMLISRRPFTNHVSSPRRHPRTATAQKRCTLTRTKSAKDRRNRAAAGTQEMHAWRPAERCAVRPRLDMISLLCFSLFSFVFLPFSCLKGFSVSSKLLCHMLNGHAT